MNFKWEGYNTMACAYGKEGEKCFVGNNTLTADEGQGGSAGPSSKLKSNEVTYTGKLIFSTGLKHQNSKRLFCIVEFSARTICTRRNFSSGSTFGLGQSKISFAVSFFC